MQQENKYEKLPNSKYPKVRQQVVDRIVTFEKVIEEHAVAQKEALKMVYEQLEEAKNDLKWTTSSSVSSICVRLSLSLQ